MSPAAVALLSWLAQVAGPFALHALPAPGSEPPPPTRFDRPLECAPAEDIQAGAPLVLRCAARPGLAVVTVLLYLRRSGSEDFLPAPTLRSRQGWYTAALCGDGLTPGPLHYYFQALDARGALLASHGDEDSPNLLTVRAGAGSGAKALATAPASAPAASRIDNQNPLAHLRAERQAAEAAAAQGSWRPAAGSVLAGLALGYGYGWHAERTLDFRRDVQAVPGTRPGGLVITPELGYLLTERVLAAIALRWGMLEDSGAGDGHQGAPARHSWAALLRGGYRFGRRRTQLQTSAALGAGDGFRLLVRPDPGAQLTRNDSVRAGPVLAGLGLGLIHHLGRRVALTADLRGFAGLPAFATVMDFNAGLQFAFAP